MPQPQPTLYRRGLSLDREIINTLENGQDLTRFPLWHRAGIPTVRGALIMATAAEIDIETEQITGSVDQSKRRRYRALIKLTGSRIFSAFVAESPHVAKWLAFRDAVQRLCC